MQIVKKGEMSLFVLYVCFFGSGFAALLYQVVWLKYLNLLFGNTTYATAAVLSAFMFGLFAGSRGCIRFPFLFRASLRMYGILEIGIGIFALFFPWIYHNFHIPASIIFQWTGPQSIWYNLIVFLLSFLVLFLPTSFMGATLPLLSHYAIHDVSVASKAGAFYGVNTAGAVAGTLFSAFLLIPELGLKATVTIGVLVNLSVGLLCFLVGKISTPIPLQKSKSRKHPLLILYAFSGLIAIAYEVIWTRILVLHLGSSVYAYAIMLSVFLLGISMGSSLMGKWLERRNNPNIFGWLQLAWALSLVLQFIQFHYLSDILFFLATFWKHLTVTTQFLVLFIGTLQILFIPTFLSGALFPAVVQAVWKGGTTVRESVSLTYSYNTLGGILGAMFAGLWLLPAIGTQLSLALLASMNLCLGWAAFLIYRRSTRLSIAVVLSGLFLIGLATVHFHFRVLENAGIFRMEEQGEDLLSLEEDISATVSVEKRTYMGKPFLSLSLNGINVAGTSPNLRNIQKLQGHIPMILFGPKKKKEVLHIGFGSGGTAYSVSLYPNTDITVVELSPAVVRNANNYFREVNHGIVDSGQLKFIYFDGRSFLQNTNQTFDVILSDSIHPRYSGNGSLYTKDYYEIVYRRLNEGGVHSQWIPLYSVSQKNMREILRAFFDVFPNTWVWYINSTINPYIIVTGQKGVSYFSSAHFEEAFQIPRVREDLMEIQVPQPYFLYDYFLLGCQKLQELVRDVDPHIDDLLSVEYESSRIISREGSWFDNFRDLLALREPIDMYMGHSTNLGDLYHQFYDATGDNLKGQLYFLARKPEEAKRFFALARQKNKQDRDPYEYENSSF